MKMNNNQSIDKLTLEELNDKIFSLKLSLSAGNLKEKHKISECRKQIARKLTSLNFKKGEAHVKKK